MLSKTKGFACRGIIFFVTVVQLLSFLWVLPVDPELLIGFIEGNLFVFRRLQRKTGLISVTKFCWSKGPFTFCAVGHWRASPEILVVESARRRQSDVWSLV